MGRTLLVGQGRRGTPELEAGALLCLLNVAQLLEDLYRPQAPVLRLFQGRGRL